MPDVDLEDLDDLIAGADDAPALGEDEDEDTGPEVESNEVPQDGSAQDEDEGELADEDVFDEAGGEQDGPEDEEEEGDEPDPEPEPGPDPRDQEVAQLKATLAQQTQILQQLQTQMTQGQQQPQAQGPDPVLREAVHALVSGGDVEERKAQLRGLPAHVVRQARDVVLNHDRLQIEYMVNPGARYRDQVSQFVEDHVRQLVEPLYRNMQKGRLGDVLKRHEGVLKTQADKDAVADILDQLPAEGWDVEKRLAFATELYESRKTKRELTRKTQKATSKEKDLRARRDSRRGSGRSRPKRGRKKTPELGKNDWDLRKLRTQIAQDNAVDEEELRAFFGE